ncbi:hypothetical protein BD410DRAFT_578252 [Rickenella mellea]|uniref:Uncharacterized protein n=1 Tax=Rickenella mellea TaxID=50990 RepID=A0A4Y7QFX2_9AGAM|nr:hypothetical protein BD410DRAFT_578252 [Rickenella mellea]
MMFVIWSESQISTYILITGLLVMSWDALPVPVFGAAALLYAVSSSMGIFVSIVSNSEFQTIGIAFIVVKLFGASFGIPKSITDITKIYDPAEFATTDLKIFSRWFFPTLWGGLSIAFASQCLNFDFDNQVGRTGADVASFSRSPLVVEPAPEGEPEMGPGFVIPSHIPGPFTKTYFSASLAGLVLAHVMLITGLSCAGIGPESMLIDAYFLSTVSVALPAQFVVVFTLAVLRGEARKFWKYAWVPTAKSSLLDDVLAGHDEDGQMVLKDKRILK